MIDVMKLALEALETLDCGDTYKTHNAAKALRAAIEQAEKQEPVATLFGSLPVYDVPPQRSWQGLTDDERKNCLFADPIFGMAVETFTRAIEQALKEKNT